MQNLTNLIRNSAVFALIIIAITTPIIMIPSPVFIIMIMLLGVGAWVGVKAWIAGGK